MTAEATRVRTSGGFFGMVRSQGPLAYEEARAAVGWLVTFLLVAAPLALAPYLAGLAADESGRVASDVAYLTAMMAVHGLAVLLGVMVPPARGGETDVWLTRGFSTYAMVWGRAVGLAMWAIVPSILATAAAATAASVSGAADFSRCWIVLAGFPVTFALAALLATRLPRISAQLVSVIFLIVLHLVDAGVAAAGSSVSLGFLDRVMPSVSAWDAWPGEIVTLWGWFGRAGYGILCGAALLALAAALARRR